MSDENDIIMETDEAEEELVAKKIIRVLAFTLGGEHYCVDIRQAKTVVKVEALTRVPNTPEFIVGVTNLRGEIVPLVDIRYFFGLEHPASDKTARVIITDVTGSLIGVMADSIAETVDIDEESIQPPLATLNEKLAQYTKGQVQLGNNILILLDMEKVLKCEDIERLKNGETA